MSVNIAPSGGRKCEGKRSENNPRSAVACCTVCFRPKHSAQSPEAGLLTLQIVAAPARLPIPKNSGLMRRPLAAYSGGTVRDLHPLPSSLASTTSTSGSLEAIISFRPGQSEALARAKLKLVRSASMVYTDAYE